MFTTRRRAVLRESSGAPGPLALLREAIEEVTSRRRLIRYLVQADAKKRGSDTVLGNLWWILDPLLSMVVYVVFVTIIARRPAPDYPLFIFSAILPWKWYSSVVGDSTVSVVGAAGLIKQIAFPKIVLPVATATAGIVGFTFGLIPLLAIMLAYPGRLTVMVIWIPVIAIVQYVFSLASAIFFSAANVFFRDLGNVITHVLRLWWFLSPSLYALSALDNLSLFKDHPTLRTLAGLNPFAILFEAYRAVIYGTPDGLGPPHPPELGGLLVLLLGSIVLVGLATIFFKKVEPEFAKVL
jgi:ABC-type polysaccharide/polyol phosphate export permease